MHDPTAKPPQPGWLFFFSKEKTFPNGSQHQNEMALYNYCFDQCGGTNLEQSVVKMLSKRLFCQKTPFCICPRKRKSPKFRDFLWLRGRFSSVTQKSTSRSCWAGKCDCFCDNTGEHDCRLLFFAVEVLIFTGSKTGLTLENGLKVCLTGKSERCGDLTV